MLLHPLQSLDPTEDLKLDPHEKPNLERSFFVLSELHFGQTTRSSFFARVSKLCPQSSHLNSNIGIWISITSEKALGYAKEVFDISVSNRKISWAS